MEVAGALFETVEQWVCSHGMTIFRGPLNPSTNYEVGMLVDGFDTRPTFMMPYNPSYYNKLVEGSGFRKEKDLVSFMGNRDEYSPPEWIKKIANRVRADGHLKIRTADRKRPAEESALAMRLYRECWSRNWGFAPPTDAELSEMSSNLQKIYDPDFLFFLYWDEEPVGVAMAVPDISPLLKRLNGSIGILGLLKMFLFRKQIDGLRGMLFGIKEEYREKGLPFVALDHVLRTLKNSSYRYIELGWNLEENEAINQLENHLGAKPAKRYRIYRKWFSDRW